MPEMSAPTTPAPATPDLEAAAEAAPVPEVELIETDLLVEDVSIDGMCGVY